MKKLFIATAITILFSLHAAAADGDLDLTFNVTGFRITDINTASGDVGFDLAVQPDGKILAIGAGNGQHAVIRYNPTGTLDTTFSGDGIATLLTGSATAGALQTDGKIVVAGLVAGGSISVVRFNANGTPDTTFDTDGQTTINYGTSVFINAVLVSADGKILLAGYRTTAAGGIFLARLNSNGSVDTAFDGDGSVITVLPGSGIENVNEAIMQPDGKILFVGFKTADAGGFGSYVIARLNTDGSLDTTFDGDGVVVTPITPTNNDEACCVGLQTNGKIVVGGLYFDPINQRFTAIARYNSDGSADTTLDGDGVLTGLPITIPSAMLVQADNRIIIGGTSGTNVFRLLKLTSAGALDTTFSADGSVGGTGTINTMMLQPDGKLLVSGSRVVSAGNNGVFTARYSNTSLTPTSAGIGVAGRVVTPSGRGLRGAVVYLQLQDGAVRSARTGASGYFRFGDLDAGQTAVLSVASRKFAFAPTVISLADEVTGLVVSPPRIAASRAAK